MARANLRENRFEADFEKYLITQGGYKKGSKQGYDYDFAINTDELIAFLKETQPKQWARYTKIYPNNPEYKIMHRINRVVRSNGLVYVLREGFKDRGIRFKLCYFQPESNRNKDLQKHYEANRLKVIRQFKYSDANNNTIDVVLMLNGIPIVAIELKDNLSNQDVHDAIIQWKTDRDPREKVFRDRILVYFAVDLNEAYMTTKLEGKDTKFLPFNQGSNGAGNPGGAGNPVSSDGYNTSYLWRNILSKDNLMLILHRFLDQKDADTLIFPRYHQLDVVKKLVNDTRVKGSGERYLIQHSAGSGKSYSIAWLAFQLSNLHNANDQAIFDSVIVVTDRVNLDRQLQNTINGLDHTRGLVAAIGDNKSSKDLAQAIEDEKRIIITTIQKFPFITDNLSNQKDKQFAIIIDEAHQGQYGKNAQKMTEALTDREVSLEEYERLSYSIEEETPDYEDKIAQEIASQGKHENLSYYAFTATPKKKTLELFGTKTNNPNYKFKPFHVYSMRQAIEEGFILDVLQNYMTYTVAYQIAQSTPENDPNVPQTEAIKTIKKFASLHETNISQKTAIMIEAFMDITRKKINGKGKAMLVTSSRKHAVRYYKAFQKYIREHQLRDEIKVLVAFSGKVKDQGFEYSEAKMNGIKETELPQKFHDDYNMLIVAEKYQTGFDEPYLHTMFVDKKLKGVKAVQTLSRLNRTCEGKHDTFVLDFVNDVEDIQEAFRPYYQATTLDKGIDYNMVYDLQDKIHQRNVYRAESVDRFMQLYLNHPEDESVISTIYNQVLEPVVNNYLKLSTEDRYNFRTDIRKLIKSYRYSSQIISFNDRDLHEECIFLSYLNRVLPSDSHTSTLDLKGKLSLQFFKLKETFSGSASLEPQSEDEGILENPKDIDKFTYSEDEEVRLSVVIEAINKYYEGELSDEDIKIVNDLSRKAKLNPNLEEDAKSNDKTIYEESFFPKFYRDSLTQGYKESNKAYEKLFKDEEYSLAVMKALAEITYRMFNQR